MTKLVSSPGVPNPTDLRVKGIHFDKKGEEPWPLERLVELGGYFQYKDVKLLFGQPESRLRKFIREAHFPEGTIYLMCPSKKDGARTITYLNLPLFLNFFQATFTPKIGSDSTRQMAQSSVGITALDDLNVEAWEHFVSDMSATRFAYLEGHDQVSLAQIIDDTDNFAKCLQKRGFPVPSIHLSARQPISRNMGTPSKRKSQGLA